MFLRTTILAIAVTLLVPALADEPSFGPAIEGYGPSYPIDKRDVPLREGFVYKAVFDIAQDPVPGSVNKNLVSVARYLNMHARNGVPVENLKLAIVVHGPAVKNLLHTDGNPNLEPAEDDRYRPTLDQPLPGRDIHLDVVFYEAILAGGGSKIARHHRQ